MIRPPRYNDQILSTQTKKHRIILVFSRGCLCDHLAITTRISWPNSGRINVPVLSDSSEKKDDPYPNWDVTANPIVFLTIGCLFLDMMSFFLESSSYKPWGQRRETIPTLKPSKPTLGFSVVPVIADFEATISHDVTENDMKGVHVLVFTRWRQEREPRNLPESASYPDASL